MQEPDIIFDEHARARMRERQVSEEAVRHLLRHYDVSRPAPPRPPSPPAIIYEGEYQGRRLKVYVRQDSNPAYVVTVAWKEG